MSPKPELRPVKPETDTETDPLIEAISTPVTAPDPFDLEKLKLDQNFVESAGVKKLLTKVPVRKPDPQRFVQVHPGKDYRMALAVILLNEESETFLLTPPLARELAGEFVMVMMRTVITKQGTVFLGLSGSQTPTAKSTSGINRPRTRPRALPRSGYASSLIRRSGVTN